MKHYDVYGIGNALVDTEYEVSDKLLETTGMPKGMMTLIDEAERQALTSLLTGKHKLTPVKQAGGGSAANTLVTLAQLGSSVFYSCKVAADASGDFFMADLEALGIDTNLAEGREDGATGQCIAMITPDAERTMTTCLGITQRLSPGELNPSALGRSRFVYIEGYLVASPSGFEAMLRAQQLAREAGVKVALTLSDPAMVEGFRDNFQALLDAGVDLLFCNLEEAKLMTGAKSAEDCVRQLRGVCPQFTITLGSQGALSFDGSVNEGDGNDKAKNQAKNNAGRLCQVPGKKVKAVDATGAGDVYAGAFLHTLCQGQSFAEATQLANQAAALLVSAYGARLSQGQAGKLR